MLDLQGYLHISLKPIGAAPVIARLQGDDLHVQTRIGMRCSCSDASSIASVVLPILVRGSRAGLQGQAHQQADH